MRWLWLGSLTTNWFYWRAEFPVNLWPSSARITFLFTVVYDPGCNVLLSSVSDHYVDGATAASAIPCGAQFYNPCLIQLRVLN